MVLEKIGDEVSDESLVLRILANQDNFAYLIRRYEDKLLRYILRLSNFSREEAEDILQDVFLKVYLNLNDFDKSLKFSSWIYRIAHNQVINEFRKNIARPQNHSLALDDKAVRRIAGDFNIEKDVDSGLLKNFINNVLRRLEPKYREVIVLRFLEQKSYEEISDIIKRPTGTVSSLLNKAKKEFRKEVLNLEAGKLYAEEEFGK